MKASCYRLNVATGNKLMFWHSEEKARIDSIVTHKDRFIFMINSSDENIFKIWKIDTYKIEAKIKNGEGSGIDKMLTTTYFPHGSNIKACKEIFGEAHFLPDCWESCNFSSILGSLKNYYFIKA